MDTTALVIYVSGGMVAVIVVVVIIVCFCWYKRCRNNKEKSQKRMKDKYMQTIEEWLGTGIQVDVGTSVATSAKGKSDDLLLETIEDESDVASRDSGKSFKEQSEILEGSKKESELSERWSASNKSQSDCPAESSVTGIEDVDENIREDPNRSSMISENSRGRKRAARPDTWLPSKQTMRTSHNTSTR